jgi:hypothetical protein
MNVLIRTLFPACRLALLWAAAAAVPAWAAPQRSPISTESETAFFWGDFAALEKQNAYYKSPGHITVDGSSELEFFRIGLGLVADSAVAHSEPYLRELEALTRQWTIEHPKSAFAHILYANVLISQAWSYRGGGFAKDVPPLAWKDFNADLVRAATHLKDHADVALTDSYAHVTLLRIGKGLGWEPAQLQAIAQDGIKRNPQDISLYFEVVGTLVPKWGGDSKTLDKYIRQVTESTRDIYGSGMYARLYAYAAELDYGYALFDDSAADWSTMKQAYEDMHARYTDTAQRRNDYALMACLAKDKDTLRSLLKELGDRTDAKFWGANPERTLETCRRWAAET